MTLDLAPVLARLEELIARELATGRFPGLGFALTTRDQTLHAAGYGLASLETGRPVDEHTLFEIGSIGKSFTSFGLMQLLDEGRLDPAMTVKSVLPWFEIQSEFEPITLHHLLTHTAAIERGSDGSQDSRWEVFALRETRASLPPGQKFHYSNSGWKTLGLVLERLRGQPYARIIRERVLAPLGMDETAPVITHAERARMATGYVFRHDDRPFHPLRYDLVPAVWFETATADGCIASNAVDMAKYARALLNQGGGLVKPETYARMTTPYIARAYGYEYGYGLMVTEKDGHKWVGHGGGMVGYHSHVLVDVDGGFGAAALGNGPADFSLFTRYALELLNAAAQGQELPPLPAPADPASVENAEAYAGEYHGPGGAFSLRAANGRLLLRSGDAETVLLAMGEEHFFVDLPGWERHLLRFHRAPVEAPGETGQAPAPAEIAAERTDPAGDAVAAEPPVLVEAQSFSPVVLSASLGVNGYAHSGTEINPADSPALPEPWRAFPGFYRAYNPWFPCFTILARAGKLVFVHGVGIEQDLVPLADGSFRLVAEGWEPERVTFHDVVDGQALRARMAGCDYTRFGEA